MQLVLQDFRLRDKGKSINLSVGSGDDFFPEAKRMVMEHVRLQENEEVFFCVYASGFQGRLMLYDCSGYWRLGEPRSLFIYYWVGERPESPSKKMERLEEAVSNLTLTVRALEARSSSALDRKQMWKSAGRLELEEIRDRFACAAIDKTVQRLLPIGQLTTEEKVQANMEKVLGAILPPNMWRSCAASGLVFGGRMHKIDLVLFSNTLCALEYVDVVFEFKTSIKSEETRRDVSLQLVDRMAFIFQAQPLRQLCWGIASDACSFFFVQCRRDLSFSVSSTAALLDESFGLPLLAGFLSGPAELRGYIPVVMPKLWGCGALSSLMSSERNMVFALDEMKVAKVSADKSNIINERRVMEFVCQAGASFLCAELFPCEIETGCKEWPYGFQMKRIAVLTCGSAESLTSVIGDVLWRLAVLHELGYVHNDVKPSNILMNESEALLGDFGSAVTGTGEGKQGSTEAFRIIEGCFEAAPYQCDLEGLYWTALALWLWLKKGSSMWPQLSVLKRKEKFAFFGFAENLNEEGVPTSPVLFAYLCGQAKARKLFSPLQFLQDLKPEKRWVDSVSRRIAEAQLPSCPRHILEWFCKRWNREAANK